MAVINPDLKWANSTTSSFYFLNDLNDPSKYKSKGASYTGPAFGNTEALDFQSIPHNLTSPWGSDNFSTVVLDTDFGGVKLNTVVHPTGKNMYYRGVGGIVTPGYGNDFTTFPPGWSWYWTNPHLQVTGTITVDGKLVSIDTSQSLGLLERQYGAFRVFEKGFYLLWAYLPNGIVVQVWVISPRADGTGPSSMVTIWHPNGLHEVPAVNMSATRAWDLSISKATRREYFNKFRVALTAHNMKFNFEKSIRDTEIRPVPGMTGLIVSESYCEGTDEWDGEVLPWFGHCEELSARKQGSTLHSAA
ncbi:hypothetical protein FBEOM_12353 [Fusarium beomiforme]|uniref:Uncharacterized protein n=1 Tax=Fusarium beomiforme TaxID=44412 RepID=A0A9P5DTH3_9HYPO|nr:hypothetical protein FBEOM_12353 [Fusarium beomiforme]